MGIATWSRGAALALASAVGAPLAAQAASLQIQGTLDVIALDQGGGVYSGTPLGTPFSGFIDDASFSGQISDGTTLTSFSCCIAAGGLEISNDEVIDAATAALLNQLTGSSAFAAGQVYDAVNLEGDAATAGGGRIEIGVSYILDAGAFSDTSPGNYPFDPADVRAAGFFILEENSTGQDIYEGIGQLVAEPSAAGLALCAALALALRGSRRSS